MGGIVKEQEQMASHLMVWNSNNRAIGRYELCSCHGWETRAHWIG